MQDGLQGAFQSGTWLGLGEPGLKLSDADQGHRHTPLLITKLSGRAASLCLGHSEVLSPYYYCTGSFRLTVEKLHFNSAAALFSN